MTSRLIVVGAAVAMLYGCASVPDTEVIVKPESSRPLSAVAVTQCGLAVALFVQLDESHMLRADPRQSDLFTAVDGQQRQSTAPPMAWDKAYQLAGSAVLSSHVILPCTDKPSI